MSVIAGRRSPRRQRLGGSLDSSLVAEEVAIDPRPLPPECQCGRPVVYARSTSGHGVILDADGDGQPKIFARGSFLEVAGMNDITGRRALRVQPSADGQFRLHVCPMTAAAETVG